MKHLLKLGLIALLAATLTACTTTYHSYNFITKVGYSDKEIAPGVTQVSYIASPRTGSQKTYLFAMKRAAEVTLEKGYRYFDIMNKRTFLKPQTTYAGGMAYTSHLPMTILKIRFRKTKSEKTYDAKKVFSQVEQR